MKTRSLVLIGVLIIALAAMAMPVMAADSDQKTAEVTADITGSITIAVSDATIDFAELSSTTEITSETITVTTNYQGWAVKVHDALDEDSTEAAKPAASVGALTQYTTASQEWGTKYLSNDLQMKSPGVADPVITGVTEYFDLTGTGQNLFTSNVGVTAQAVPIHFNQRYSAADDPLPSSQTYRIVATFDAGAA